MTTESATTRLTYGSYLRVPELLALQTPLAQPPVPDEMLFVIGQQAQELWFKQMLHDLRRAIELFESLAVLPGTRLLNRLNQILRVLGSETEVLETLAPEQFHRFRGALKSASGFESVQFRELELASGLRDEPYLKMVGKFIDIQATLARWPVSLHDCLRRLVAGVDPDPVRALAAIYHDPGAHAGLYAAAEAFSDYELRLQEWRFHHFQLVERVIGDRAPGTGGSAGGAYLLRTLGYRLFPELWEARNLLSHEERVRNSEPDT